MYQALAYEPFVRRIEKYAFELFFERCKAAVAKPGELLDGYVVEDIVVYYLFEALFIEVCIGKQLGFQAIVTVREYQIHQFGYFQAFGDGIVRKKSVAEMLVYR